MKSFLLKDMLLVSFLEKRARRIEFDPQVTTIRGENKTGKSSLIKSIVRTFGTEVSKLEDKWVNADVKLLVRYEIEGRPFALLRHGDMYAAFDGNKNLLGVFHKVTRELAPFLSKQFGFALKLPDKNKNLGNLPPAFYLLPFYMDQDASWARAWSSFARLDQYPRWKKSVSEYHAGIRGKEFYEAQAKKTEAELGRANLQRKREGLQEVYSNLGKRFDIAQFSVDVTQYEHEVQDLLRACEKLRSREEAFKEQLSALHTQRESLKTQLGIATHARKEARADYDFAQEKDGHTISCPTCGAGYENSFAERFAIAVEEDRCAELVTQLTEEILDVEQKIEKELAGLRAVSSELEEVQRLLGKREGELALGDIIKQAGRKELRDLMVADIGKMEAEENTLAADAAAAKAAMKKIDSKEHRDNVNGFFHQKLMLFLCELGILGVAESSYETVDMVPDATGSELPRALLAYQMAFLHTMQKFSACVFAPIILDSPNQQDQDDDSHERIMKFIRDHRPEKAQLVLGFVDSAGVDFGGKDLHLTDKHRLLREDDFPRLSEEIGAYVDTALR